MLDSDYSYRNNSLIRKLITSSKVSEVIASTREKPGRKQIHLESYVLLPCTHVLKMHGGEWIESRRKDSALGIHFAERFEQGDCLIVGIPMDSCKADPAILLINSRIKHVFVLPSGQRQENFG